VYLPVAPIEAPELGPTGDPHGPQDGSVSRVEFPVRTLISSPVTCPSGKTLRKSNSAIGLEEAPPVWVRQYPAHAALRDHGHDGAIDTVPGFDQREPAEAVPVHQKTSAHGVRGESLPLAGGVSELV